MVFTKTEFTTCIPQKAEMYLITKMRLLLTDLVNEESSFKNQIYII